MGTPPPPPSIWQARDARAYLDELCTWKQAHEPGFSYRKLTRAAALGSPSYIQTYIRGERNLKQGTAAQLAAALELDEAAAAYFVLLVRFTQADDDGERIDCYKQLLQLAIRHGDTGKIDAARLAYFSHWHVPVIHAMASLRGFRPDPHWIAARVVPKIRPFDARKALDTLAELGIFAAGDDGSFVVRERRLAMEPGLKHLWIREYHRAMIALSIQALELWPAEERVTSALTVTVPREHLHEALARVDDFRRQMWSWLMTIQQGRAEIDGEVVQMNFQAFRLSDIETR